MFKSQFVNVTNKKKRRVIIEGMIIKGVYCISTLPTIKQHFYFASSTKDVSHGRELTGLYDSKPNHFCTCQIYIQQHHTSLFKICMNPIWTPHEPAPFMRKRELLLQSFGKVYSNLTQRTIGYQGPTHPPPPDLASSKVLRLYLIGTYIGITMCTEECPNVSVSREYMYVIHTLNPLTRNR